MQRRVRVSLLKAMVAVGVKGSAFIVTDSNAMARVVVAWLSRIGFLLVAAFDVPKGPEIRMQIDKIKPFAAQQGKLVFIQERAPRFPNDSLVSGEVL